MPAVFLENRSLISVAGAEAEPFLQNLITTDLAALTVDEARPGALLTPQGKILFDFMVWRDGAHFVLETDAEQSDGLLKRLVMYRLRAPVEGRKDARFAKAGIALVRTPSGHDADDPVLYDDLRIDNGIPVSGRDFALQDAFPHDVLMDLNGGLSFRKGCYVGQEVVSRMQHRGTARRRVVTVVGESGLPATGTEITSGGKPMGTLGSISGNRGLAILRIDRAGDAIASATPILAGEVAVSLSLPAWSGLVFPSHADEASA
jgi:folate-binding protein YgfZ